MCVGVCERVCICVWACVCVCVYACGRVCVCICVWACVCVYVCGRVCAWTFTGLAHSLILRKENDVSAFGSVCGLKWESWAAGTEL